LSRKTVNISKTAGSGRRSRKPHKTPSYKGLTPSSASASLVKSRTRGKNSQPELALRRALFRQGGRYRIHGAMLPGKPDIVFPASKVVVFVDGDFWHGRGWQSRKRRLLRGANPQYWVAKIETNRRRDQRNTRALRKLGWTVIRVWESEVFGAVDSVAARILRQCKRNSC
jgi:DNA mismatch endonuclease (patch repair protein)